MKALMIPLFFFIATSVASDIDTMKLKTQPRDITVYFSGAEITRKTRAFLSPGRKTLVFERLPAELYPQSIRLDAIPHARITAIKHEQYSVSVDSDHKDNSQWLTETAQALELQSRLEDILHDKEQIRLAENSNADRALHSILNALNEQANPDKDMIHQLLERLESGKKRNPIPDEVFSRVTINLHCAQPIAAQVSLRYFVPSAKWSPAYDFYVADTDSPVKIYAQARISQSTGEVWKNSTITVSSRNPNHQNDKPELQKWVIDRKINVPHNPDPNKPGKIQGRLLCRKSNSPIALATVFLHRQGNLTGSSISDNDGYFEISPVVRGIYDLEVNVDGYENAQTEALVVQSGKTTFQDIRLRADRNKIQAADIVSFTIPVIAGVISPADRVNTLTDLSGQLVTGTIQLADKWISGKDNATDANYYFDDKPSSNPFASNMSNEQYQNIQAVDLNINTPQTILSDGQEHLLIIEESSVDARYVYYSIPKVQTDVYLLAEIENRPHLKLLPGIASIFYRGSFCGEQTIDHTGANDTLKLVLGREPKINIRYQSNAELSSRRSAGNDVKEMVVWDIVIENGLGHPVSMVVEDQVPISSGESVVVKPFKSNAKNLNRKNGFIKWEIDLAAHETRVIRHGFTIQYPVGTRLYTD